MIIERTNTIRLKIFSANCMDTGMFKAPRISAIPKKTKKPTTMPRITPAIILNAEGCERGFFMFFTVVLSS